MKENIQSSICPYSYIYRIHKLSIIIRMFSFYIQYSYITHLIFYSEEVIIILNSMEIVIHIFYITFNMDCGERIRILKLKGFSDVKVLYTIDNVFARFYTLVGTFFHLFHLPKN